MFTYYEKTKQQNQLKSGYQTNQQLKQDVLTRHVPSSTYRSSSNG